MNSAPRHPIRIVALRTGLSCHVIRSWERRYAAIAPQRTDSNRRLYSDQDIHRLRLLRWATRTGRTIGQVARLSDSELEALLAEDGAQLSGREREPGTAPVGETPAEVLETALDAAAALDPHRLDRVLSLALVRFSAATVLGQILLPLMVRVGENWQQGSMKIVHEHVASVVVRNVLGGLLGAAEVTAPAIVVATPSGQVHELGALAAAATAVSMGWRSVYLGPSLPAEEIAAAVAVHRASVVALSVVHPADDPRVTHEIRKLRRSVGDRVAIVVGGRAAPSYRKAIEESRSLLFADLDALKQYLGSGDASETADSD